MVFFDRVNSYQCMWQNKIECICIPLRRRITRSFTFAFTLAAMRDVSRHGLRKQITKKLY
jgi:hypothetical protein